ncbi:helix-turn-helix domain-containing protein [Brevibacillus invocatus]|uniref:helix-turn-helix domain-containing protein n=1 Tax=Brevibacillus invocatus TaxID=173959 RepID=UPI002040037F|nr:helix-turn-helix domain-containing protein [Brevibacillus invocatus]MCM3079579.1 helix-turn-helix domain-containing protein [Brevibacillus invocatus]MCM3429778.1 helix-turn-helix domain-containing protein [Brevibacillus invocatus]
MQRLTVKEAAMYIGASEYKVYEMVRKKEIPHYRIGSKILFSKSTIDQWLAQQEAANCVTS